MLNISGIFLNSRFILAPLAGYTDLPFRILCREHGAGLCISEMISCHGIVYSQPKTFSMMATTPEECPTSFQLFGADPEIMGKAAAILARHTPDLVDINMGCPVPKVTKRGAGAALMKNPEVACKIVENVRKQSKMPVTVKFRAGIDSKQINAVSFAKMMENAGAASLTIHGRTWAQGFTGTADWGIIAQVKDAVSIPVIGNGDIQSYGEGILKMAESGCDGVMIGRAALGNPWVFSENGRPTNLNSLIKGVNRHLELIERFGSPTDQHLGAIKNHLGRYFKNFPGCSNFRKIIFQSNSYESLKNTLFERDFIVE